MQIVNIQDEAAPCSVCGLDLVELGNFTFLSVLNNTSVHTNEQCQCKKCGTLFVLHYDYFDSEGHINNFVFNGDVNDPGYNWQDQLTMEQKNKIGKHLTECKICTDRLNSQMTSDAWLASLLHKS